MQEVEYIEVKLMVLPSTFRKLSPAIALAASKVAADPRFGPVMERTGANEYDLAWCILFNELIDRVDVTIP